MSRSSAAGTKASPPAIAGKSPHDWLRKKAHYYEEIMVHHRAKCEELRVLKKAIRLQPDKAQCQAMRKALPACRGWADFVNEWHPGDLILVSHKPPATGPSSFCLSATGKHSRMRMSLCSTARKTPGSRT